MQTKKIFSKFLAALGITTFVASLAFFGSFGSGIQASAQTTSNCSAASGSGNWNGYPNLTTNNPNPVINTPCQDMPMLSYFPINTQNNNPRQDSFLAGEQLSIHFYYNPNGNITAPRAGVEIIKVSDTQYRITGALSGSSSLTSANSGGDLTVNVPAGYAPRYVANTTKWYPQRQTRAALASQTGQPEDIIIPDTRGNGFTYNSFLKRQDSVPSFPVGSGLNISYQDTDRNAQKDVNTPDALNSTTPFSEYGYILASFQIDQVAAQPQTPNLSITKSANKTQVVGGDKITYTLNYANTGDVNLTGVVISDTLDSKVDFTSCSNSCSSTALPTISWNIGSLAIGATASVTYVVTVKAGATGNVVNTARIKSNEVPEKPSNEVVIPILQPGLNITKSADKVQVVGGDKITYTLNYANTGNTAQTNVKITDALDSRVTFVSCTNTCVSTALPTISWNIGNLAVGASGSVSYIVSVNATATGIIPNVAKISSTETPEKPSNQVDIPILQPGLGITKAVDKSTVNIRDTVTYTLNYTNTGTQNLTNVKITDTLDIRLEYVAGSCGANCSYDSGSRKITWNIGNLNQNQSASVTFKAVIAATATGIIPNSAIISADNTNPVTSNIVNVTLNVPVTPRSGGETAALLIVLLIAGGVGYFYYKQRQGKFKAAIKEKKVS